MFLYFYISIDIGALVRTTGAKDPSACLASLTLGNHSYAFVFYCAIILYIWYIIIISHMLAGHSTLLTTSSHIPETNTKFPHSWIQLIIHLQIQIQSPCLACFAFVKHAYSKHKYIYKFNQRVWSCDGSASIRMYCESNQNLIFLRWNWSV